jgi:hypothetical protein
VTFFKRNYFMYMSILSLSSDTPEEGIRSHYRWLWATMGLLGIELRSSGRALSHLSSPMCDLFKSRGFFCCCCCCFGFFFCQAHKIPVCVKDPDMVANDFNLPTWEAKEDCELKTSLSYWWLIKIVNLIGLRGPEALVKYFSGGVYENISRKG